MVSSFKMNSSICSSFSHLRNAVNGESADELSLNLLGSVLSLHYIFVLDCSSMLLFKKILETGLKFFRNISQGSYKETQT